DGSQNRQRCRLAAENPGAQPHRSGTGRSSGGGLLGGKAALAAGDQGNAPGRVRRVTRQQAAQRHTAALIEKQRQVIVREFPADGGKIGQRQRYLRQNAPAALFGSFGGNAGIPLV